MKKLQRALLVLLCFAVCFFGAACGTCPSNDESAKGSGSGEAANFVLPLPSNDVARVSGDYPISRPYWIENIINTRSWNEYNDGIARRKNEDSARSKDGGENQ